MQTVLRRTARCAASEAPVLIQGETGSGKEVIARVLHANSARAGFPFVPVNVAALPAELLESELFGHARGAFTGANTAHAGLFEAANKGILFLDEVGEMPAALQAKLLRVLEDGEVRRVGEVKTFAVDVRIVCATHRDLVQDARDGRFREDLLYRLKVLTLEVPPLRARKTDIMPLAEKFLQCEATHATAFDAEAEAHLLQHQWPGNVRELHNAVRHGAAMALGSTIGIGDLPSELDASRSGVPSGKPASPPLVSLAEAERAHVLAVLEACNGVQSDAARMLEIGRNTLWRRLKQYADQDPTVT